MAGYTVEQVRAIAEIHGYKEISLNETSRLISFRKDSTRINVYYTTGTVGTCLNHPRQGKTQLFRRNVSLQDLETLFENPRSHTGKGYYQRKSLSQDWEPQGGGKPMTDMARRWVFVAAVSGLTENPQVLNSLTPLMNRISRILWEPGTKPCLENTRYLCGSQSAVIELAMDIARRDGAIGAFPRAEVEDGEIVSELLDCADCRECGNLEPFLELEGETVEEARKMLLGLPKKLRKHVCDWIVGLLRCGNILVDRDYEQFAQDENEIDAHWEYAYCFLSKTSIGTDVRVPWNLERRR